MSAETLRRAAALMSEGDDPRWLAVADWLDDEAAAWGVPLGVSPAHALAVARAYLEESA